MYERGARYSGPFFAAFYARNPAIDGLSGGDGPRIGFTVPRSLGGAVVRNRIKRRVREAVRLGLDRLNPQWEIVFNPRRAAMNSPFAELEREIQKLFHRCNNS